jgi:hypothetical protein
MKIILMSTNSSILDALTDRITYERLSDCIIPTYSAENAINAGNV